MAFETLNFEKKGKVAIITMNRPESLNALTYKMSDELTEVFHQVDEDKDINVSVLTGNGRGFNVGADMKEAARVSKTGEKRGGYSGYGAPAKAEKPVIAAINGICCGGGLILLGGCDIVIASDQARFFDPHVEVGWLPLGETFATATYIPFGLAMRMALMGNSEKITPERAFQMGLISEIVPHDKLMQRATEIATTVASKAPLSTRWIRQAMRKIIIDDPHAIAREEVEKWIHLQVNLSHDGIEGPRSFAEGRKAQFNGEGGPAPRKGN